MLIYLYLVTPDLEDGGGGYSYTLTIGVCAAVRGMVFKPFCQEQGIEKMHFRSGTGCQT